MGYSRKKSKLGGGWGYTFLKTPLEFLDLSFYPYKFQRNKLSPLKILQNFVTPWKFQVQKPRSIEIYTWIFCEHPWKFHFFFNWPQEFAHVFSSVPLEIPCRQPLSPPVFFWNSPMHQTSGNCAGVWACAIACMRWRKLLLCAHSRYLYCIEWIINWYQKFIFHNVLTFQKLFTCRSHISVD